MISKTSAFALSCVLASVFSMTAFASTYDLSGVWNYSTSAHWKEGVCPLGTNTAETLTIVQQGETFTLSITSGMECDPGWTCTFSGTVSMDDYYFGGNDGVVDEEGGWVSNSIDIEPSSATSATGCSTSYYTLNEMDCSWGHDFTMTRAAEEDTEEDTGAPINLPLDSDDDTAEPDDSFDGSSSTEEVQDPADCDCKTTGRINPSRPMPLLTIFSLFFGA